MRRLLGLALLALVASACETPPAAPPAAPIAPPVAPPVQVASCLSIAAWNDLHGQLGPDEVQIDNTRVPAGGVIALADQIAALRALGDPMVLLDAGDLFTGPLDSTLAEGAPVIDAYNVMGVD